MAFILVAGFRERNAALFASGVWIPSELSFHPEGGSGGHTFAIYAPKAPG